MPQDNASVIVKRDTKSVIDQTPKVNGQMLWTTDVGQDNHIYTDVVDPSDNTVKRIQIGGISPETEQAIQQAVTDASASASSSSTSATNASNSATEAESYAKGGTGSRQGEDTDNSKYYKEQADASATNASTSANNASTSATTATNKATEASTSATNASNSATQASEKATLSESYAKGGTGTRQGEDTDNAEYYKEQAKAYAESASQGVQPATPSTIGGVKPDNVTITVDGVGAITAQEVQEITQANFDALTTKNPKIAYFVKSSTSGTTGRIWYNDSWFGGSDITIDTVLDTTSNNPIANSAVATALADKQNTLTTSQLNATNSGITSAKVSKLDALPTSTQLDGSLSSKANKSDITNISITGSTNNTGSTITSDTLFYWNGSLFRATTDIPNNATIVIESNCSSWTTFVEMRLMFSRTDNLTVTNNNSTLDSCTSLASVWQAVKWNYINGYGKICESGIGALDHTSVKNVIPNPPGFGNYTPIKCKFEASEEIIAIYAIGAVIGKLAKCYLFRDRDDYYLTDWQILR